ncbi:MAG: dihydroorotase [Actinomycetota bacterium]
MSDLVITNGTVVDAAGTRRIDLRVANGVVAEAGEQLDGDTVLDADGLIVAPGFVDLQASLGEPGDEEAETIQSGSRSAALGGYTAVVAAPTTDPIVDSAAVVGQIHSLAHDSLCEVLPSAAITQGLEGGALTPMAELVRCGVRIFTDGSQAVQDARMMRTALDYAGGLSHLADGVSVVLASHCDVESLSAGASMHEGEWSSRLGIPGSPAEAEELMISRDIALARLTGGRLHIRHVTTARGVDEIRRAKSEGLAITAEATPHHLCLDHSICAGFDSSAKFTPPLRPVEDVAAVRVGLLDGTLDAIVTDHAPHTRQEAERPFLDAPAGSVGLETAFAVANTELGADIEKLVELLSINPARIAGIEDRHGGPIEVGRAANLVLLDLDVEWTVRGAALASRSANTPFEGRTLRGNVRHTIWNGEHVVNMGEATR